MKKHRHSTTSGDCMFPSFVAYTHDHEAALGNHALTHPWLTNQWYLHHWLGWILFSFQHTGLQNNFPKCLWLWYISEKSVYLWLWGEDTKFASNCLPHLSPSCNIFYFFKAKEIFQTKVSQGWHKKIHKGYTGLKNLHCTNLKDSLHIFYSSPIPMLLECLELEIF